MPAADAPSPSEMPTSGRTLANTGPSNCPSVTGQCTSSAEETTNSQHGKEGLEEGHDEEGVEELHGKETVEEGKIRVTGRGNM